MTTPAWPEVHIERLASPTLSGLPLIGGVYQGTTLIEGHEARSLVIVPGNLLREQQLGMANAELRTAFKQLAGTAHDR